MSGRILVVDDENAMRQVLRGLLVQEGFEVSLAPDLPEAIRILESDRPDVVLTDLKLPSGEGLEILRRVRAPEWIGSAPPVILLTAFGSIESAVQAVKEGAYDYLTKPYDEERLLLTLERALSRKRLLEENASLRTELAGEWTLGQFPTASPKMYEVLSLAKEVAKHPDATVLILGESGTGKEVLARALHNESRRRDRRFVAIHCGAIPDSLLESELFGYEKGAFSGAAQRKKGKIETADGGTLFLDEIGDMPTHLQVKLLRVLQDRSFERLGGLDPVKVDVRVIAATHRDLARMVQDGAFREDLYYRLNVFPLALPPLRERPEDIEFLAAHFVRRHAAAMGKAIADLTPEALEALRGYDWPGNVREMENLIERAVILSKGDRVDTPQLPILAARKTPPPPREAPPIATAPPEAGPPPAASSLNLEETERTLIRRALEETHQNQSEAARRLGITRSKLRTKLARLGTK
ncbi:MAG: sigma-54-dependent Fis family transcriptional regulator [Nitrospirae bacterium]|nr:sigma-54-dependent Fis family transcriptional regulator [Nitrospirota bacterium]